MELSVKSAPVRIFIFQKASRIPSTKFQKSNNFFSFRKSPKAQALKIS